MIRFLSLSFMITAIVGCSDGDSGASVEPPPPEFVGLWADQNEFNALNTNTLTCNEINAFMVLNEKGQKELLLDVVQIQKNGVTGSLEPMLKGTPAIYTAIGTLTKGGVFLMNGTTQKELNEELLLAGAQPSQVKVDIKFVIKPDNQSMGINIDATKTVQGKAEKIPIEESLFVKIDAAQMKAVLDIAQQCF